MINHWVLSKLLHHSSIKWVSDIGMTMIVLWSDRNCMRSANLSICWTSEYLLMFTAYENEGIDTELFETSHLAGMQISIVNIFRLSLSTKMLPKVMFSLKSKLIFSPIINTIYVIHFVTCKRRYWIDHHLIQCLGQIVSYFCVDVSYERFRGYYD